MTDTGPASDPDAEIRSDEEVFGQYNRDGFLPVASWAMYDFANTIYSAIVVTFFLTLYVTGELGGSNTVIGAATFASMIFSALISPFLGALPDRTGRTKFYLILFTAVCCGCTALLSVPSSIALVIAFYFVANVCYQVSMVFYNSLLPVVASPRRQGFVSGIGVALGYIGVILGLLMASVFIGPAVTGPQTQQVSAWNVTGMAKANSDDGVACVDLLSEHREGKDWAWVRVYRHGKGGEEVLTGSGRIPLASLPAVIPIVEADGSGIGGSVSVDSLTEDVKGVRVRTSYRNTFLSAGALFLIFSLPLFIWVSERKVRNPRPFTFSIFIPATRDVLRTVAGLFRSALRATFPRGAVRAVLQGEPWRRRNVFLFLLGNFLCVDVLNTAIQWFSKYMVKVFSFDSGEVILFGIAMSSTAFLGGLLMGKITQWVGPKPALLMASGLLMVTLVVTGLFDNAVLVVGCIMVAGACGLAGLWVAGRKLLIELAPPDKIGEYFGLYGITIKVSVVGTLLFSLISDFGEKAGSVLYELAGSLPGGADMHWNYRLAILAQLVMLVPGFLCLAAVSTQRSWGGLDSLLPLNHWFVRLGRAVLKGIYRLYWPTRVVGMENLPASGPVILAGNHPSYLDPIGLWTFSTRRIRFMTWEAVWRIPLLRAMATWSGAFPKDTDEADRTSVRNALRVLKKGEIMGIFPEGERSHPTGALRPFAPGVFRLAERTGALVTPAVTLGSWNVWPSSLNLPRPGHSIVFVILPPLDPSDFSHLPDPALALARAVEERIRKTLARAGEFGIPPPPEHLPEPETGA